MQVLVATRESQGVRDADVWSRCAEGEPVRPVEVRCGRPTHRTCGCDTTFVGVRRGGRTTTAVVRDLPDLTVEQYAVRLAASMTADERRFVNPVRSAEELVRPAIELAGRGVIERWDQWVAVRFAADGTTLPAVSTIADDPDELAEMRAEALLEDLAALEERRALGDVG